MPQTGDTPRLLQIVRATKCEKLSEADYTRGLDPATAQKVHATPGMASTSFYQSVIHAVWTNTQHPPFGDPRVRRALHLVLDRPVLVDVVKDMVPMLVGGFLYPFSALATPPDQLSERLGYHVWLSLSRLNHWLPRGQAHPEVVQRTAEFHHEIADALLPQADPVFHNATTLDAAVDMLDP